MRKGEKFYKRMQVNGEAVLVHRYVVSASQKKAWTRRKESEKDKTSDSLPD